MRLPLPLLSRRVRLGAVVAVAGVICYFSLLDAPPAKPPSGGGGLLAGLPLRHVLAYAGLAGVLAYATVELADQPRRRLLLVVGVAVAYGAAIELLQAPLPDRHYSELDMLANALGVGLALPYLFVERAVEYVPAPFVGG